MAGQKSLLTGHLFTLPVILTEHKSSQELLFSVLLAGVLLKYVRERLLFAPANGGQHSHHLDLDCLRVRGGGNCTLYLDRNEKQRL